MKNLTAILLATVALASHTTTATFWFPSYSSPTCPTPTSPTAPKSPVPPAPVPPPPTPPTYPTPTCPTPTVAAPTQPRSPVTSAPVPTPPTSPVVPPSNTIQPPPSPTTTPPSETKCAGCTVFQGTIDYTVIGNSMSYSEDRTNCNKKTSSSAVLSLPTGAKVEKAFLQWSGSGSTIDKGVTFNGKSVAAGAVFAQTISSWTFFAAYADVTALVNKSDTFTVQDLAWSNDYSYCNANAAYGAWSLVVVYSSASIRAENRIHLCQDSFRFTYPANNYTSSIGCVQPSATCPLDPSLSIVTYESDRYKGEYLYIGNKYFGDNIFDGSTAPNLDIEKFNVSGLVTSSSTTLPYSINTYLTNTVFGAAIEGLFDFVKVLKYTAKCNAAPVARCKDASVCAGQKITTNTVDGGSTDSDGTITSLLLSNEGPFNTVGTTAVNLTATDDKGATSTCQAKITVQDCRSKPVAKCADLAVCAGASITPVQVGYQSSDADGFIKALTLSNTGPFPLGKTNVTLTATDNDGLQSTCIAVITGQSCSNPPPPTKPPTKSPVRQPTKTPTKSPVRQPTKTPTKAPVRQPTNPPVSPLTSAPTTTRLPPKAKCDDLTICTGESIKAEDVGAHSRDPDGVIKSSVLSNAGPFATVGTATVTLTVNDNDGLTDTCHATITVKDCSTPKPTDAPVKAPTDAPVKAPTDAPVKQPTDAPVKAPADAPVKAPTDAPVKQPTDAPVRQPTDTPVRQPTDAPARSPTASPTPTRIPPKAICDSVTVCVGASITPEEVGSKSFDPDGTIKAVTLSKDGPFDKVGVFTVTLTVKDNDNLRSKCDVTVTVQDCATPKPATSSTSQPTKSPSNAQTTQAPVTSPTSEPPFRSPTTQAPVQQTGAPAPSQTTTPPVNSPTTPPPALAPNPKAPVPSPTTAPPVTSPTTTAPVPSPLSPTPAIPQPTQAPAGPVCVNKIKRLELIDAKNDTSLFELPEYVRYSDLYQRYFNIEAVIDPCPGQVVQSVRLTYDETGLVVCDKSAPFSVFGDKDGDYREKIFPLGGPYTVTATPFTSKDCSGTGGETVSKQFYAVGANGTTQCPGIPAYFDLYNADTDSFVQPVKDLGKICLPDYNVNFKASIINCKDDRVMSVKFELTGAVTETRIDEGNFFFFYSDDETTGDVLGNKIPAGKYKLKATSYSRRGAVGIVGGSIETQFEFVDCSRQLRGNAKNTFTE